MSVVFDAVQNVRKLQTNQYKNKSIQDKGERFPHCPCLESHIRREEVRTHAAEVETAGYDCEHTRSSNRIGTQISHIGREDAQSNLNRSILDVMLNPVDDDTDDQPNGDPANRQIGQAQEA